MKENQNMSQCTHYMEDVIRFPDSPDITLGLASVIQTLI